VIDFKRRIEQGVPVLAGGGVDQRGKRRGEGAHQVGMAEDGIAQRRLLLAVLCARALDNIANFDIRRAGDFAALAVDAVFQRLVVQRAVLQAQALAVRPGLFRPG
jgi:hypothetical protein